MTALSGQDTPGFFRRRFGALVNSVKGFANSFKTPADYQGSQAYNPYHELSPAKKIAYHAYETLTLAPIRALASVAIAESFKPLAEADGGNVDAHLFGRPRGVVSSPAEVSPNHTGAVRRYKQSTEKAVRTSNGLRNPIARHQMRKSAIGASMLENDKHSKKYLKSIGY
jgi:hypothetical protein